MTIADYPQLIDRRPAPEEDEELYPSSDGEPMGETLNHVNLILETIGALRRFFADRPDVLIAGNNLIYYTERKPGDCVSPDTYVVSGVTRPVPKSFFTWLHDGRTPDIVFEYVSEKTWRNDCGPKKEIYQNDLRVGEYIQFDPTGEFLQPQLQGFRLVRGRYVPIKVIGGRIRSEFLGLEMYAEGVRLRLFDPRTQTIIPTGAELAQIAKERAVRAEDAARDAAEERARADEARNQATEAMRRADAEKNRADEEKRRADDERQQRLALEARLEALERQLNNA